MQVQIPSWQNAFVFSGFLSILFLLTVFILGDATKPLADTATTDIRSAPAILKDLSHRTKDTPFSENEQYKNLNESFDFLWDQLLTPNGGYIVSLDGKQKKKRLGISMFHQLHCLGLLREEIQSLRKQISTPESTEGVHGREITTPPEEAMHTPKGSTPHHHTHDFGHPLHCFDYLRQAILCNADATLELPKPTTDGSGDAIDGMGMRRCKDWTLLYSVSEQSDHSPVPEDTILT